MMARILLPVEERPVFGLLGGEQSRQQNERGEGQRSPVKREVMGESNDPPGFAPTYASAMKIRRLPDPGLFLRPRRARERGPADIYPRQPGVDILHYAFHLTLTDETDSIEGEAMITLRVVRDGVNTLTLDLVQPKAEAQNRGMTVSSVTEAGKNVTFEHASDRLTLSLTRPVAPVRRGPCGPLSRHSRDGPPDRAQQAWRADFLQRQLADQGPPVAPHARSSLRQGDDGDVRDRAGPLSSYRTGSWWKDRSRRDRRLTHWRNSVPIATWLNVLGAARFAVDHRAVWRGLPIETWVYRQDRDNGFAVFANPTPRGSRLPFRQGRPVFLRAARQALQANGVRGGMESATSIFYGDDSVNDPSSTRWLNVIIHETAHQWFGNAVTENDWDHVAAFRGFATYFTHLFIEHAYGRDEFIAGLRARTATPSASSTSESELPHHPDNLADMSQVLSSAGTYKKAGGDPPHAPRRHR